MKKLIYVLIIILLAIPTQPVELLIHLQEPVIADMLLDDGTIIQERGSICVMKEDGHPWGTKESPKRYIILEIPGVTVAQAQEYLAKKIKRAFMDSLFSEWQQGHLNIVPDTIVRNGDTTILKRRIIISKSKIKDYIEDARYSE